MHSQQLAIHEAHVAADAVDLVDDVVALGEVQGSRCLAAAHLRAHAGRPRPSAGEVRFGDERKPGSGEHEAPLQLGHHDRSTRRRIDRGSPFRQREGESGVVEVLLHPLCGAVE
jgi:hypothetical protein